MMDTKRLQDAPLLTRILATAFGDLHTDRTYTHGDADDVIKQFRSWRGTRYLLSERRIPHDPAYWERAFKPLHDFEQEVAEWLEARRAMKPPPARSKEENPNA